MIGTCNFCKSKTNVFRVRLTKECSKTHGFRACFYCIQNLGLVVLKEDSNEQEHLEGRGTGKGLSQV